MSLLPTINARGVVASRPAAAAANEGYNYYGTDTGILYRSNGSSWDTNSSGFANPMTTAGDLMVGGASGAPTRLAGSGTDGFVATYDSTATPKVKWAAGGGGGGSGDAQVGIVGLYGDETLVGTWSVQTGQPGIFGGYPWVNLGTHAQNDAVTWTRWLQAGTYSLLLRFVKNSDHAIHTFKIDGSSVGTIDGYNGSSTYATGSITGIVVGSSGTHDLQMIAATKNASASSYYMVFYDIILRRTA